MPNLIAMRKMGGKSRGDTADYLRGGYEMYFPIMVCDLEIPPPPTGSVWVTDYFNKNPNVGKLLTTTTSTTTTIATIPTTTTTTTTTKTTQKPLLLFFGPPTDPKLVNRLVPILSEYFTVHHYDDASEAIEGISEYNYVACVAKLGSKGNLGIDVVKTLRQKERENLSTIKSCIIIHSTTAVDSNSTTKYLYDELGIDLLVDYRNEQKLVQKLKEFLEKKIKIN